MSWVEPLVIGYELLFDLVQAALVRSRISSQRHGVPLLAEEESLEIAQFRRSGVRVRRQACLYRDVLCSRLLINWQRRRHPAFPIRSLDRFTIYEAGRLGRSECLCEF